MYTTLKPDDFRRHLGLSNDYQVEGVLLSGTWDLRANDEHIPFLVNALDKLGVEYEMTKFKDVETGHAHEINIGNKHYWFVPVMGTAVMSVYAHIASVLGSKKNILIGVVGGLAPGIKPGDFILPTRIYGNDNALKYQPNNTDKYFYPNEKLYENLKLRLPINIKVWSGETTTCEVMLAETKDDVANWSRDGYLGVEMEGAMIFALSNYFSVPAAAIFTVSDNLIENETILHNSYKLSKEKRHFSRNIQYEIAIRELLDIREGAKHE